MKRSEGVSMEESFQKFFSDMNKLAEAMIPVQQAITECFRELNKVVIKIKRYRKYHRMMMNRKPKKVRR